MSNKKQKYGTTFESSTEIPNDAAGAAPAADAFEQATDAGTFAQQETSAFAQKSVDQAQAAFDKATEVAHGNVQLFDAAASAYKSRFADLQMKAMEIGQTNVNATFAFARQLFAVRQPAEFFSMQQDFLRAQAQAFSKQAAEIGELSVQLAKETAKPVQEGFMKSFGDLAKPFAA